MAKAIFPLRRNEQGKSTALMQVAHNYEEQGNAGVLILKPQVDTKGGDELVSRLGVRRKADLLVPPEVDVSRRSARPAASRSWPVSSATRASSSPPNRPSSSSW